jgi:hypothetical protein
MQTTIDVYCKKCDEYRDVEANTENGMIDYIKCTWVWNILALGVMFIGNLF